MSSGPLAHFECVCVCAFCLLKPEENTTTTKNVLKIDEEGNRQEAKRTNREN